MWRMRKSIVSSTIRGYHESKAHLDQEPFEWA